MIKRHVAARRLTHGEKSALEDAELRKGGTHWLKIPVEALFEILDAEGRARWDEMTARIEAMGAAAKGGA
jgi:hypothetical protein